MNDSYPFKRIEKKWRKNWEAQGTYRFDPNDKTKSKKYILVMFSYPSEKKLHIGHWWNYGGVDTYSRFLRLRGYNVFEPMGFDAFGLPAENYAIKHGIPPAKTTENSINSIREQLKAIGAMYDWNYEINTSRPEYYKWTQWLFLQLYKTGAAYQKQAPVNWCPDCQTVLANEQVESDGSCERCGTSVIIRDLKQWFFRITDFADELITDLDNIDWPEATKTRQKHWIGRSEGTEIDFRIDGSDKVIHCFTTRPDTLFGVTYIVLAPEHDLVNEITVDSQSDEINEYIAKARILKEYERQATDREKTGVFTGSYAINPATNKKIPIWIADYVLGGYGTGAVMAVPAHDQRDFEFTQKYNLPIKWVIRSANEHDTQFVDHAFEDYGIMYNSGEFNDLRSDDGKKAVTKWLENKKQGRAVVSFRLRDWLISRQRYWGAPIPIVHCPNCGTVPVPEDELPLLLPEKNVDFKPQGSSPLGSCREFIDVKCPKCGISAKRDPDTMDTFVCSSWYYYRYLTPNLNEYAFSEELVNKWLPIDLYVGGPEHATGHLIYARYINKYLKSIGLINYNEPFSKLIHQGIITHKGQRMSKSKGNVVNPDEFVNKYGSDCFRLYLQFMGDFRTGGDWSDEGIVGIRRFQNRIWRLVNNYVDKIVPLESKSYDVEPQYKRLIHYTIREVTQDIENFTFNTAISRLMEFVNEMYKYTADNENVNLSFMKESLNILIILLGPLAPHMAEELWQKLGNNGSLFDQQWPDYNEDAIEKKMVIVVIQVKGKLTEKFSVPKGTSKVEIHKLAMSSKKVIGKITGREVKKVIYIQDKIFNIVV
ncbi:leucine--tRNA ligase [bacterium]|nr:leucine--tRNA ligase [bacterium]